MKKVRRQQTSGTPIKQDESCVLCRFTDDDPALFGEKVKLKDHKLSVHYFCLLTSCGVYQRGEEDEGVFGFLVEDIKQEARRSNRLTCFVCKRKGACVGCDVRSCRKKVHFPCGRKVKFISQFTGRFPSYCETHSPSQSLSTGSNSSLPQSCSICLDPIKPVLSYSVLKCPSCHASWFHRDCVQRQAHSAGLFFFKCTLCNNKDQFQEEMLRMGIFIPERDASWELEANAYSELLEVYEHCDSLICLCDSGRTYSAKSGWFEVIRCRLCGSKGTHRKCSGLELNATDWACSDCTRATDGRASLVTTPQGGLRRSLLSRCHLSPVHSSISCKRACLPVRSGTPEELLPSIVPHLHPVCIQLEVDEDKALSAGLGLVRRPDFDPSHTLSIRFRDKKHAAKDGDTARRYFFKLLLEQIQDSVVFEGPVGSKNLALDSQALRGDLYFDLGCLLALVLVHGGPPVGFFSPALYQCLFNYPANRPLSFRHMTPETHLTHQVMQIAEAKSLDELREAMAASWEFLELAGCNRPISSLGEREVLVEDLVSFTMITRMQLPLQRFREGLQTLGVFDQGAMKDCSYDHKSFTHIGLPLSETNSQCQVQLFPSVYCRVFCQSSEHVKAQNIIQVFNVSFSEQKDKLERETPVVTFWRHFLLECEVGRSSVSLQDVLRFATGADRLPPANLLPPPSVFFLHCPTTLPAEHEKRDEESRDQGLFPQSKPELNILFLPVTSTYKTFKSSMEQAISHHVHLLPLQ